MMQNEQFKAKLIKDFQIDNKEQQDKLDLLLISVEVSFDSDYTLMQADKLLDAADKIKIAHEKLASALYIIEDDDPSQYRLGREYPGVYEQLENSIIAMQRMEMLFRERHANMPSSSKKNADLKIVAELVHEYWTQVLGRKFTHDVHRDTDESGKDRVSPVTDATNFSYMIIKKFIQPDRIKENQDVAGLQNALRDLAAEN